MLLLPCPLQSSDPGRAEEDDSWMQFLDEDTLALIKQVAVHAAPASAST